MRTLTSLLAIGIGGGLCAQSPLTTTFDGATFLNDGQVYFDLVVNTTITLQGLDANTLSTAGTTGSLELWLSNPGTTTFLGNELTAGAWSLASSGTCISAGPGQPSSACLSPAVVLQPGSYGVAVRYAGLAPLYSAGTGSVVPGGGPGSNQTYSNAELTLLAGASQATPFVSAVNIPRVFNGSLVYYVGNLTIPCSAQGASNDSYGPGCYRFQTSFWDVFDAADAAATLSGNALTMIPTGNGYLVQQGVGVTYLPPTGAATTLTGFAPNDDDGDVQITLPTPLTLGDGSTVGSLFVHSNGMVSTGSNHASFFNSYFPFVVELLEAPNLAWYSWHDYNIAESGSGAIKTELVGSLFCVTWDGVESYTAGQANPSTLQFQFDLGSGLVNYVWDSITPINGGAASDVHLIGFSPGGASIDHGEADIAAINGLVLEASLDRLPLTLTAAPRPVLGQTVVYTTSNETTNPGIGLFVGSVADLGAQSPAGLDLGLIGAPGCVANVDLSVGVGNVIGTVPGLSMTAALPIPIDTTLNGFEVFGQSVWLDPSQNTAGLLTSNAMRSRIGSF